MQKLCLRYSNINNSYKFGNVEMITNFYRLDEATQPFDYKEIARAIKAQLRDTPSATPQWISGKIQQLTASPGKVRTSLQNLEQGLITDPAIKRDISNAKRVYDILADYGVVNKSSESTYSTPRDKDFLSKIKQNIFSREDHGGAVDNFKKKLRAADFGAAQDFVESLPPRLQAAFEKFVDLDKKDLAYMANVNNIRDYAKQHKTNYSSIIKDKILKGSEGLLRLQQLKIINSDGTLNLDMINSFKELLSIDNAVYKIKPIAKDFHDMLEKMSSDMAYHDNAVVKRLAGSDVDEEAANIVSNFSDKEKELYLNKKITSKFRELGLVTPENKYSDLGKAVGILLKNKRGSLSDVEKDIGAATGRKPGMGPLTPSEPDQGTQNIRKQAKVDDIKRRARTRFSDNSKFG